MKDRNAVEFIFLLLLSVAIKEDWGEGLSFLYDSNVPGSTH